MKWAILILVVFWQFSWMARALFQWIKYRKETQRYNLLSAEWERTKQICLKCGYDLRATPERCPECGEVPRQSMFNRFTDRSRVAIGLATALAGEMNRDRIGDVEILGGVMMEGGGIAVAILKDLGVDREALLKQLGITTMPNVEKLPREARNLSSTHGVKRMMRSAILLAKELGHNHVGTEHILLGMLDDPRLSVARILVSKGVSFNSVREQIVSKNERDPS